MFLANTRYIKFNRIYQSSKRYTVRILCMHSIGGGFRRGKGKMMRGYANLRMCR